MSRQPYVPKVTLEEVDGEWRWEVRDDPSEVSVSGTARYKQTARDRLVDELVAWWAIPLAEAVELAESAA